jgi:putative acetyltransferase
MRDCAEVLIRRETPRDVPAVAAVTTAAFAEGAQAPEPVETTLLARLRADPAWLPALSLVAVGDGAVIGHVVCTRGYVGDAPALGLGPISVRPDRQRGGVGHALMHAVLGAADATDEALVALVGDPAFYRRFGFVAASELGIVAPDPAWGRHFQARALNACPAGLTGTFRYAPPFAEL